MTVTLRLQLLGGFHLAAGDRPVDGLDSPRLQSLVARLALHPGVPQPRQQLAYLYWPDSAERQARTNLRRLLYDLRLALPDADRYLDLEGPALAWRADAPYTLDVAQFQAVMGQADTPEAIARAAALYRGDLLPHLYDEWLLPERARLREAFTRLLERGIAAAERAEDVDAALGYVRRLVEHDPLHEPAYRHLMHLAALRGDRTGVVQAYRACVATLEREVGAEPSEETRALYEQLRTGLSPTTPGTAAASTVPPAPAPSASPAAPAVPPASVPRPMGTVTVLFTDIEGSTRLLHQLGERYGGVLAEHQRLLREAFAAHAGYEVDTQGDSFFVAFARAEDAVAAAVEGQRALAAHPWPEGAAVRVRMGLHTGTPSAAAAGSGYVGADVHRAEQIAAAAHGGQVLLSAATRELVAQRLPDGVALRELGAHRLKDLAHPEQLGQLVIDGLPADFPPLRTLDVRPHNLPLQATPLVGREREVAAVRAVLHRPGARLVTLTGPGGTGKTRLALQVAAEALEAFPDGAWFVDLAPIADPALVAAAVAGALGVKDAAGQPLVETLTAFLHDKQLLLVLDNFEQLLDAAPLVDQLLAGSARLTVLATSRAPLRVYGEHEYPVPPLALPDPKRVPPPEQLSQYEAVRLFIERAQAVKPDFAVTNVTAPTIAEICHRLDGLPLAIELAAARVRLLPPQALLARLGHRLALLVGGARTLAARQQTLRATIEWSYRLLDPGEQALFARLAVFAGGATLEAIEAVRNADGDLPLDVLEGVESLVAKSLLRQEEGPGGEGAEPRFVMLETLHEYARERLAASDDAEAVRHRHAAYFLALADRGEAGRYASGLGDWLARLEREHDNLRAALGWALDRGEGQTALRLAGAVWLFWSLRGHLSEGRRWLEAALAQGGAAPAPARVRALVGLGWLSMYQRDPARAQAALEQSLALARELGDQPNIIFSLNSLGAVVLNEGDYGRAQALFEEALALARQVGNRHELASILLNMGGMAAEQGEYARAGALLEECLGLARPLGRQTTILRALLVLAMVALGQGDQGRAGALMAESLGLSRALGDRFGLGGSLDRAAWIAAARGQAERAARLAGASAALFEAAGISPEPIFRLVAERHLAPARAQLGETAWAAAWEEGRAMPLEQSVAYALAEDIPA